MRIPFPARQIIRGTPGAHQVPLSDSFYANQGRFTGKSPVFYGNQSQNTFTGGANCYKENAMFSVV